MDITDLRQIHDGYDHIYLSPHLDDAALSCGGSIARHCAEGLKVLVVTLCTAPPPAGPFSALAEEFHHEWGLPPDEVVAARLREDTLAIEQLSADSFCVGMLDAIYRLPERYGSRAALVGAPDPADPLLDEASLLIAGLRARAPRATFYAPLGVGGHVDHQIVCQAAMRAHGDLITAFYEDFPYVVQPGALEARLAALGGTFVPSTIDIDSVLTRKIGAIEAYASQLGALFGGAEAMRKTVTDYAEGLRPDVGTYGERLWLRAATGVRDE